MAIVTLISTNPYDSGGIDLSSLNLGTPLRDWVYYWETRASSTEYELISDDGFWSQRVVYSGTGITFISTGDFGPDEQITGGWIDGVSFRDRDYAVELEGEPYWSFGFDIEGIGIAVRSLLQSTQQQVIRKVLSGDDIVTGSERDDIVVGFNGNDRLDGGEGADLLDGGAGNDWLAGRNGDDTLKGRDGNDKLIGGRGRDVLHGGEGQDTFVFNSIADSAMGARRDVIQDFQTGIDKLDLSRIDANGDPSDGDQSLVWIGSSNFTYAGQVRFADGILEINTDDNLRADFQLRIKTTIDGADLIV